MVPGPSHNRQPLHLGLYLDRLPQIPCRPPRPGCRSLDPSLQIPLPALHGVLLPHFLQLDHPLQWLLGVPEPHEELRRRRFYHRVHRHTDLFRTVHLLEDIEADEVG